MPYLILEKESNKKSICIKAVETVHEPSLPIDSVSTVTPWYDVAKQKGLLAVDSLFPGVGYGKCLGFTDFEGGRNGDF